MWGTAGMVPATPTALHRLPHHVDHAFDHPRRTHVVAAQGDDVACFVDGMVPKRRRVGDPVRPSNLPTTPMKSPTDGYNAAKGCT